MKPGPAPAMSLNDCEKVLLIAIALTRFSIDYERGDPELAEYAWQLVDDRLLEYDLEPDEAVRELLL